MVAGSRWSRQDAECMAGASPVGAAMPGRSPASRPEGGKGVIPGCLYVSSHTRFFPQWWGAGGLVCQFDGLYKFAGLGILSP